MLTKVVVVVVGFFDTCSGDIGACAGAFADIIF